MHSLNIQLILCVTAVGCSKYYYGSRILHQGEVIKFDRNLRSINIKIIKIEEATDPDSETSVRPDLQSETAFWTDKDLTTFLQHCDTLPPKLKFIGFQQLKQSLQDFLHAKKDVSFGNSCLLIHGRPGIGKSMLVQEISSDNKLNWFKLPFKFCCKHQELHNKLMSLLDEAKEKDNSILLIDKIDLIGHKSSSQLNSLIHFISSIVETNKNVKLVAITNEVHLLDPNLRMSFTQELEVGLPNFQDRLEIIKSLLGINHSLSQDDLKLLSERCERLRPLDIKRIILRVQNESKGDNLLDISDIVKISENYSKEILEANTTAYKKIYWKDIGGQENLKMELQKTVIEPLKNREVRINPLRGFLFHGPPGCSKTMLAQAIATESGFRFIAVKGPELLTKYVGETERKIRQVFSDARSLIPCIIFFDEIESLALARESRTSGDVIDNTVTTLLSELDSEDKNKGIVFIGATNMLDNVDNALLQPGRIEKCFFIGLPDEEARKQIIEIALRKAPLGDDIDFAEISKLTDGYTGAELTYLCNQANHMAFTEGNKPVLKEHISRAIAETKPAYKTSQETIK